MSKPKRHSKIYENKHDEVNEFLQRKEDLGRSRSTLNEYSRNLREFFNDEFSEVEPADVEVRHIEEYLGILSERDVAQNTKRRYLESLSSFFDYAMKRPRFNQITGNPVAPVLEELPKVNRSRPDCATWENACKIVHEIPSPRNRTIAAILAKTGCRLQEALEIELEDLLIDDGFIRLRVRKGGGQTVVPVDEEMVRAIERYKVIRTDYETAYLFPSNRGDRLSKQPIRKRIKEGAVEAGVMEQGEDRFHRKFTPHTFRTVFTTAMRNAGMSNHVLQYIRGDSDNQTMDIYTRVDRTTAREEYLDCIKSLNL
ncbi:tyrosine-type recombinase/integrase [Halapricum desulfuricans]|uniref:XerD/XerC family integrase n=1 Tax=Halapricum desulfuricans TaxID=2841257 RepID=A0A897NW58_9EURY|nr:tyrosine-type recombinase/integrase [Halapricum desulfuricans]QSG14366.1 XerD/XerC family integrase [Halapricum desulfuricans]